MEKEVWEDVIEFKGMYKVSNLGRVKSLQRYVKNNSQGSLRLLHERIVSQKKERHGYMAVNLSSPDYHRYIRVHVLVLEVFVGKRPHKSCVCHNDGNKQNNKLNNLRYDTYSANAKDRIRHGTVPKIDIRCEKHPRARFRNADVVFMRYLLNNGISREIIEKMYKVGRHQLYMIFSGRQWVFK